MGPQGRLRALLPADRSRGASFLSLYVDIAVLMSRVVGLPVVTKERKGEATQWRNESACTYTNPMQPASHRGSHTH